eukprot:TRINITY_DN25243_c0_g1_i1.p1 TRINITY_DN25243_c0_g1~~TRINITY_DN25243_c0_g1_i1.p1  ORF type:complete len:414 (+),score=63.05 TRINITY_DN25243_c0_g1_i1:69-1310(+)
MRGPAAGVESTSFPEALWLAPSVYAKEYGEYHTSRAGERGDAAAAPAGPKSPKAGRGGVQTPRGGAKQRGAYANGRGQPRSRSVNGAGGLRPMVQDASSHGVSGAATRAFKSNYGDVRDMVRRGSVGNLASARWTEGLRDSGANPPKRWNAATKKNVGWSTDPDEPRKQYWQRLERQRRQQRDLEASQRAHTRLAAPDDGQDAAYDSPARFESAPGGHPPPPPPPSNHGSHATVRDEENSHLGSRGGEAREMRVPPPQKNPLLDPHETPQGQPRYSLSQQQDVHHLHAPSAAPAHGQWQAAFQPAYTREPQAPPPQQHSEIDVFRTQYADDIAQAATRPMPSGAQPAPRPAAWLNDPHPHAPRVGQPVVVSERYRLDGVAQHGGDHGVMFDRKNKFVAPHAAAVPGVPWERHM